MDKPVVKILIQFVFFELLFLFLLNAGFTYLPHREVDIIYYAHINLYFLIACFAYLNLRLSKLNRFLITLFITSSTLLTSLTLYSFFAWPNMETIVEYDYYYFLIFLHLIVNTLFLFISVYLFSYILKPFKKLGYHISIALPTTLLISFIIYFAFYIFFDVIAHLNYFLNKTNNLIFWINFVVLLFFWYEFAKQKHNLSEYISNILAIYTVIIGLELVHIYMIQNDMLIHNFGQYFTAILNLLMLITWIIRLHYLQSPQAKENEYYIKNYKVLYGLVEKPRVGVFEQIYHKLNQKIIWGILISIGIIGSVLFLFNQFNLFVSGNLFLLLISLIMSIFFAIFYWNKRWFQGIEFLIRKKNK